MIGELIMLAELLEPSNGVRPDLSFFRSDNGSRVVQPTPVGISEALTAAVYPVGWDADKIVITLDPKAVEIYQESERVKKALRGL